MKVFHQSGTNRRLSESHESQIALKEAVAPFKCGLFVNFIVNQVRLSH